MAMTKAEVCRAFRTVMAADYADVPANEELDYTFSPEFCAKMDALIAEQKRGSWRLLSRQARRAVVAAVILAASLLLVACTPKLREAVAELVVTVYETFVRFTSDSVDGLLRSEIETVYEFDPVPDGFELVSRNQENPCHVETTYINSSGNRIDLHQFALAGSISTTDFENSNSFSETILGTKAWFSSADDLQTTIFFHDGYRFAIRYIGETTLTEFEYLVESLLSTN